MSIIRNRNLIKFYQICPFSNFNFILFFFRDANVLSDFNKSDIWPTFIWNPFPKFAGSVVRIVKTEVKRAINVKGVDMDECFKDVWEMIHSFIQFFFFFFY